MTILSLKSHADVIWLRYNRNIKIASARYCIAEMRIDMEILRVENLTKIYNPNENEVKALNGVSFSVERGEFVAIIGSSGSGKSTLLHIIGGVDRPTSGKVYVDGRDVSKKTSWIDLSVF